MTTTTFAYRRHDDRIEGAATPLAGGTDLLPLQALGLVDPEVVVDLKTGTLPSTISIDGDDVTIGALATLADLEDDETIAGAFPAITEAVEQSATRQIRNRATVGGNLLQRPRCRYYRSEDTTCWFAGGEGCPARHGRNEHHAVFGSSPCVAVQPSDLASVLVALDASVDVTGDAHHEIAVADLLSSPTEDDRRLHRLPRGAVIESVRLRRLAGLRCSYRKAMDRAAWQFALAGVASAVVVEDDGVVTSVRLVATGVANTPWRLTSAESLLLGRPLTPETIDDAAAVAADGAAPLEHNRYKLPLLRGLVRRSLEGLRPPA